MVKRALEDTPEIMITSVDTLRDWLIHNHTQRNGIWVVTFKKSCPEKHVSASQITDACLCFGWIDSLPRTKDDARSMLYISPRKPGGNWSKVNKNKVKALQAAGLMQPAGLAAIQLAKKNGTWTALDEVERLIIPPDLQTAFDATPGAQQNWEAFPRSVKRGALEILLNAKRAATRTAKIDRIVTDSARNERPFQWRKG